MHTYYLKTKDKQELYETLETLGLATRDYDPEDSDNQRPDDPDVSEDWEPTGAYEWRFSGPGALDVIGTIYEDTGETETDEEGNKVPLMQAIEGFHANLKTKETLDCAYEITPPQTPYRKFAGD